MWGLGFGSTRLWGEEGLGGRAARGADRVGGRGWVVEEKSGGGDGDGDGGGGVEEGHSGVRDGGRAIAVVEEKGEGVVGE